MPDTQNIDTPQPPTVAPTEDKLMKRFESTLDQREVLQKQEQEALKQQQEAAKPGREELRTALKQQAEQLSQPLPEIPNIPPPPTSPPMSKDTASVMGSIGMLIAGLGGFGSRSVGMRMNAAATGLLRGFREGRYDETLLAAEQWKNLFDYQMAQYDTRIRNRQAVLQQSGMSIENKLAQLQLDEAPFMDQQQLLQLQEKGLDGQLKYLEEMTRIRDTLAINGMKVDTELKLLPYRIDLMKAQTKAAEARANQPTDAKGGTTGAASLIQSYRKDLAELEKQEPYFQWAGATIPPDLKKKEDELRAKIKEQEQRLEGAAPTGTIPPPTGKPLDANTAAAILKEAGGNKDKARQIARERGYSF